jgi:hypothetical protein
MALRCLRVALLSLALGLVAGAAQAIDYSLVGGGGQTHVGNGLMIPIQSAATVGTTRLVFPGDLPNGRTLLIPVKPGPAPIVTGTVVKPLQVVGTKQGYQRKLRVPAGVLSKPAAQTTVGIKFSNAALYAAATNLNFTWPTAPAVFSTGQPLGAAVINAHGGSMTYSNTLASRFGGAARFGITPGAPSGLLQGTASAPVTLYLKISAVTPPCTSCQPIGVIAVFPTTAGGVLGVGGATPTTVMTAGKALAPNVAFVPAMGAVPLGTIIGTPVLVGTGAVPTNMSTSQPGPWTTGKVVISMPPVGEKFTLSGADLRTPGGGGTIQLVSGALSARAASGPNANRGWVRLELEPVFGVPSMSRLGLAATAGLLLLTAGYALRRRIFA